MNDRFKFRVWDIEYKKYYPATEFCVEDLQDSGDEIIVEQCTGLRDMNGKLVYEGDVVHQTVGGLTCRIVFYRGAFCGEFVGGFTSPLSGWFRPDFDEVIGNIHEEEEVSNLESIVPPLELCKKIPEGGFEDSALVWCRVRGEDVVCAREHWVGVFGMSPVPAPTLEEILDALDDLGADFCMCEFQIGNKSYCYPTGVEEAILLWFKVKGIEVEE